jgi:N-acetylglucosaminyldiphosphoundecaprenol N-acetyl-beta-D-mannosaminyltransferase
VTLLQTPDRTRETPLPARADVLGCPIDRVDMPDVVERCEAYIRDGGAPHHIAGVNAAKVIAMHTNERLRSIVAGSDLVTADGQSLIWASRLLGDPLPTRVAGIDLMHELLCLADREHRRVYFLGAREEVLDGALDRMRALYPGAHLAGARHGYFADHEAADIARQIAAAKADMLFVGITSPRQEYFLARYGATLGVPVMMGVGGSMDVLAGLTRRAPGRIQRIGLEWLYRLGQEPRRLFRRYAVTNSVFMVRLLREVVRRRTGRG